MRAKANWLFLARKIMCYLPYTPPTSPQLIYFPFLILLFIFIPSFTISLFSLLILEFPPSPQFYHFPYSSSTSSKTGVTGAPYTTHVPLCIWISDILYYLMYKTPNRKHECMCVCKRSWFGGVGEGCWDERVPWIRHCFIDSFNSLSQQFTLRSSVLSNQANFLKHMFDQTWRIVYTSLNIYQLV